jgi:DNA mismatch endonuclease (patch repair protein)
MADFISIEKRSYIMSQIKGKDTRPEIVLRRLLHKSGLRYSLHISDLPGKPDIVFKHIKLAVFVDGDFWHGWKFRSLSNRLSPRWSLKIKSNIIRDRKNHKDLEKDGWRVLRFWEHEVLKNDSRVLKIIIKEVSKLRKADTSRKKG